MDWVRNGSMNDVLLSSRGLLSTSTMSLVFRTHRSVPVVVRSLAAHEYNNNITENEPSSLAFRNEDQLDRLRRSIVTASFSSASWMTLLFRKRSSPTAWARGLVQFPLKGALLNSYHLMRAGTSLLEEQDIISTNPLFLTNREDALSAIGEVQVVQAANTLKSLNELPTVVRFSLAAVCIDTANVIARELKLGRDRVIAEYTYLDPRAIGKWDMLSRQYAEPAVWALDIDQAGKYGTTGRPPPNEDGTPHETLADVSIRLRQLISILETLYSGDTILLIFPDGTGPALLSCLMAGIPLNRVHELEYTTGEVRFNVTPESTIELWKSKQLSRSAYDDTIERGRIALAELQSTRPESIISKKDQLLEAERVAIEEQYQEAQRLRKAQYEASEQARQFRLQEAEADRSLSPRSDPLFVGMAGAALLGAAIAVAPPPKEDSKSVLFHCGATAAENITASESPLDPDVIGSVLSSRTIVHDSGLTNGDHDLKHDRVRKHRDHNSTFPLIDATNSELDTSMVVVTTTPKERAHRAMVDYLNRDDGCDDWLQSIADILDDDNDFVDHERI